jgi:hypothetical protein
MELIVSLPGNDLVLAHAAAAGGADAVKVHMHADHRASGISFGGFSEEAPRIRRIIAECGIKVGLMPGQETLPPLTDLESLIGDGLDFIDIYAHHLPAAYLSLGTKARLIPAIDYRYDAAEVAALSRLACGGKPAVAMLEASIVPPEYYGTPLNARDLAVYSAIAAASGVPVLVPTQKFIRPEDVFALAECGVSALMIGVIVTGPTAGGIEKVTADFKLALSALGDA